MTRSTHTVKYAQGNFKKYQILAVIFALITVVASLMAAMSGIRVKTLQKSRTEAIASNNEDEKQRAEAATGAIEALKKQLATSQEQLAAEKQNVKNLIGKIGELERQISATEAKLHVQQQAAPTPPPIHIEVLPEKDQESVEISPGEDQETAPVEVSPEEDQEPVAAPPLDMPKPTPSEGTETGNAPPALATPTPAPAPSEAGEPGNTPPETVSE